MSMNISLEELLSQTGEAEVAKIKNEKGGGYTPDPRILKPNIGGTYTFKVLFNPKAEGTEKLFVDYREVGFTSRTTGQYIYLGRAPSDAGLKKDVIKDTQWAHYKKAKEAGDEAEMKASYKLIPARKQMLNVYVVDVQNDDSQKHLIGTNAVVRYAAQTDKENKPSSELYKKITNGLYGDKAAKIGKKAFLVDDNGKLWKDGGKVFVITVGKKPDGKGGFWPEYSESQYDDADPIVLSAEKVQEILNGVFDLREFIPEVKTNEELTEILNEHWHGTSASLDDTLAEDERPKSLYEDKDDTSIPMGDAEDDLDKMLNSIK